MTNVPGVPSVRAPDCAPAYDLVQFDLLREVCSVLKVICTHR